MNDAFEPIERGLDYLDTHFLVSNMPNLFFKIVANTKKINSDLDDIGLIGFGISKENDILYNINFYYNFNLENKDQNPNSLVKDLLNIFSFDTPNWMKSINREINYNDSYQFPSTDRTPKVEIKFRGITKNDIKNLIIYLFNNWFPLILGKENIELIIKHRLLLLSILNGQNIVAEFHS